MLMRLMSTTEYLIMPKGMKFTGSGKLGLSSIHSLCYTLVKSTTEGVKISCCSAQWANLFEINTPSVKGLQ